MASLTNTKIKNTYVSLLKVADNGQLDAALQDITDGAGNSTGIQLNTGGDLAASGTVSFGSLKDTGENITIAKFVDAADGIGGNDNDTSIPTSAAVKLYVDTNITAQDLDFTTDSGTGAVDLDSQTFSILGTANEIETSGTGQTVTIGLPSSITVDVTGNLTGNVSGSVTGNVTGNLSGNVTGNVTGDLTGNVTATSVLVDGVIATTQTIGDNSTKVATTAYVDAAITAEGLDFAGDSGTGTIDLDSEVFTISGTANEVETNASGNSLIVGLPSNVTIGNDLTVTTNATVGGTLGVTGATGVDGNFDVATNKFTVQAATGNTAVAGTLGVTGNTTLSTVDATGLASLDGGIDVDGAFTVADTTGNVSTSGTLAVTGITTLTDDLAVDTDTLFVDVSADRVGINKAVPTVALDVVGDITSSATISGSTVSATTLTGTLSTAAQTNITSVGTLSSLAVSGNLTVDTNTLFVDAATNTVGIGTSSPTSNLDIQSTTAPIIRIGNNGGVNGYQLKSNVSSLNDFGLFIEDYAGIDLYKVQAGAGGSHHFYINGSEKMRIDSSGNVGIGSSTPAGKFEVNTGSSAAYFTRTAGNAGTSSPAFAILTDSVGSRLYSWGDAMKFHTIAVGGSPSERMRIDSSGNVQIGGSTDKTSLLSGTARGLTIENSAAPVLALYESGGGANNAFLLGKIDLNAYIHNKENGFISIATNGTERLRVLAGGGLTFNGDTAAANALDDYEEGTFTPTLNGAGSPVYTVQYGVYTKIGNLVWVHLKLQANSITSSANGFGVSGLPYAASPSSDVTQRAGGIIEGDWSGMGVYVSTVRFRVNGSDLQGVRDDSGESSLFLYNELGATTIEFHTTVVYKAS
jgi:hypothetical protein